MSSGSIYYCTNCRTRSGFANPIVIASGFCASGQPGYPTKHMHRNPNKPIDGVFLSTNNWRYEEHLRAGAQSGTLEIDASGRPNYLTVPSNPPGHVYVSGTPTPQVCKTVKTVCIQGSGTPHAFPVPMSPESEKCAGCGKMVPERMPY